MINGILNIFLNTGWKNESCLYYKGNVYWCEGYYDDKENSCHFFIRRFAGRLDKTTNTADYLLDDTGDVMNYDDSYHITGNSMDELLYRFLRAKVFEGKSFWEVEKVLIWVNDSNTFVKYDPKIDKEVVPANPNDKMSKYIDKSRDYPYLQ